MTKLTYQQPDYENPLMERAKDEYGYCTLTNEEMREAFIYLMRKYKDEGKQGVALSRIRNEIYGREYMRECIGVGTEDHFPKGYWRCTQQVIDIANELKKRGIRVARDFFFNPPDWRGCRKYTPWKHVKLDLDKLFYLV